jgi:hypothetical protein
MKKSLAGQAISQVGHFLQQSHFCRQTITFHVGESENYCTITTDQQCLP